MCRIDRYLGRGDRQPAGERFANRMLTPIWNRENIANVQIVFKEPAGMR